LATKLAYAAYIFVQCFVLLVDTWKVVMK